MTRKQRYKEILFQTGINKIEQELDIRQIAHNQKTLNFIAQIMLTKYQRYMIPYFKENLLNFEKTKIKIDKDQYGN